MARVQFNIFPTDSKTAWGYPIEQTEQGIFGDVPDELLDIEVAAGRVKVVAKVKKVVVEEVVQEVVEEVEQSAEDVVENGTGKRVGRPKKAE